jgi:uncharacterized protein (TIGR03437 family)
LLGARHLLFAGFFIALPGAAQLVSPTAIPKGPNPPVVFLNGYQAICPGSFTGSFGNAATVLAASQIASVFFDNCSVNGATLPNGKPSIEGLAYSFGTFLQGLKYTDGTPVTQVDVVGHSMGGLIVRSYLGSTYVDRSAPNPATPQLPRFNIRKGVFLAVPNFGTTVASLLGGIDVQTQEMSPGSQFLLNLATWNGGLDDLGGLDAIAVAGDAGDGLESGIPGFDDGLITLNSASLGFVGPGITRVIHACHTPNPALILFCSSSAPDIASITDASSASAQIITSFLTGTTAWQSVGTAIESVSTAATTGGLLLGFEDAAGNPLGPSSGSVATGSGVVKLSAGPAALFDEDLPANTGLIVQATVGGAVDNLTVKLAPATSTAIISKPGPVVRGIVPAGSAAFPYAVAPGEFVSIYGSNLAPSGATAILPYPPSLAGVSVTVNSTPAAIQYVSTGQINIVFPAAPSGPVQFAVASPAGTFQTTAMVASAVPSIFSLDGSGTGPGAAINALSGTIVSTSAPLRSGIDYVSLFLTGLGATTTKNGLDYAQADVALSIGGKNCPVLYAGRAPGYAGLDQVNCQIPGGLSGAAVAVAITAGGRTSNTVTLAIQ